MAKIGTLATGGSYPDFGNKRPDALAIKNDPRVREAKTASAGMIESMDMAGAVVAGIRTDLEQHVLPIMNDQAASLENMQTVATDIEKAGNAFVKDGKIAIEVVQNAGAHAVNVENLKRVVVREQQRVDSVLGRVGGVTSAPTSPAGAPATGFSAGPRTTPPLSTSAPSSLGRKPRSWYNPMRWVKGK